MNTLSDYTDKRAVGKYYGYPECCIEFFMTIMVNRELGKKAQINRMVSNDTGFIPCTNHARQILKKKMTLEDILQNRQCETKFPNDNGKVIQELRTKRKHIWIMKGIMKELIEKTTKTNRL